MGAPPGVRRQNCKGVFRIPRGSKSTRRRKLGKGESQALKWLELSDSFLVSDGRVFNSVCPHPQNTIRPRAPEDQGDEGIWLRANAQMSGEGKEPGQGDSMLHLSTSDISRAR